MIFKILRVFNIKCPLPKSQEPLLHIQRQHFAWHTILNYNDDETQSLTKNYLFLLVYYTIPVVYNAKFLRINFNFENSVIESFNILI